jgi:hypothetical protein
MPLHHSSGTYWARRIDMNGAAASLASDQETSVLSVLDENGERLLLVGISDDLDDGPRNPERMRGCRYFAPNGQICVRLDDTTFRNVYTRQCYTMPYRQA